MWKFINIIKYTMEPVIYINLNFNDVTKFLRYYGLLNFSPFVDDHINQNKGLSYKSIRGRKPFQIKFQLKTEKK